MVTIPLSFSAIILSVLILLLQVSIFFLFDYIIIMRRIATIIGTTGVGKSQLGIELCKALRGQVINADSMQVIIHIHIQFLILLSSFIKIK